MGWDMYMPRLPMCEHVFKVSKSSIFGVTLVEVVVRWTGRDRCVEIFATKMSGRVRIKRGFFVRVKSSSAIISFNSVRLLFRSGFRFLSR